ncbi:MAG: YgjP-like metallopeptidase domain-containing protein, partial [Candidatus Izemoplasmatales bacterium]
SFIIKHQRFILKTRVIPENSLYNQDKMLIWGREYNVIKFDGKKLKIEDNTVYFPERFDEKNIEDFYRKQTIKLAISMIDEELVYSIKDIDLSNLIVKAQLMKSRLGSCHSTKRIIKLNSILARFDEKYLRAVLVHEIVHLRVGNHQTKFYQLLEKYIPDYRILSKQLNNLVKQYKI